MRVLLASLLSATVLFMSGLARADVAVTLQPTTASVVPGGRVMFTAAGGNGAYTWSFAEVPSGGSIDASGVYVAGPYGDVDDVVVLADALGTTTSATVHVGPAPVKATSPAASSSGAATTPVAPSPAVADHGINIAGGADGDNASCAATPGQRAGGSFAALLAFGAALFARRRLRRWD